MRFVFVAPASELARLALAMAAVMAPRGVRCEGVAEDAGADEAALEACLREVGLGPPPEAAVQAPGEADVTWIALCPAGARPARAPEEAEVWPLPPLAGPADLPGLRAARDVLRERLRALFARKDGPIDLDANPWREQARAGALAAAGSSEPEA